MQHDTSLKHVDHNDTLAALTRDATGLGRETVDIGGFLQDLDARCQQQSADLQHIQQNTEELSQASARMRDAGADIAQCADHALDRVRASTGFIADSGLESQGLASWVHKVHAQGPEVEEMLRAVQQSNSQISDISWQVKLLAVNAKIEAARAGQAGKGFSIVADAVNELSQKTSGAADRISATVKQLAEWMQALHQGADANARSAETVLNNSARTDEALKDIEQRVASLGQNAHDLSQASTRAQTAVEAVAPAIGTLTRSVNDVAAGVDEAHQRCDKLVDTSEAILQNAVALGGSGEDGRMITWVQDLAGQVMQAFETAIQGRALTLEQMFDTQYQPVPGSAPEQVTTAFTTLTDAILPPIQEPVLDMDPRIVFCAAVDRNGYLPTHNLKFSQPLSDDPVWNAGNCRNRRIFDDRVGLKSGRNQKPFLLQVYRRDMGGGAFVMMKDLSAPITVQGRHWGGLRLAYKF
jgi:methyl-accepting chemotaxis protein